MEFLLTVTILNVALLAVILLLQPIARMFVGGIKYALSNLDERIDEGVISRRLKMASTNQVEALALWVPILMIAQLKSLSHPYLISIGVVFLIARVTYLLVSLLGIPVIANSLLVIGTICLGQPFVAVLVRSMTFSDAGVA